MMRHATQSALVAVLPLVLSCAQLGFGSDPHRADDDAANARPLALGAQESDALDCDAESRGDCADWYAVTLAEASQLVVRVRTLPAEGSTGAAPSVRFVLEDDAGKVLRERGPGASLLTRRSSQPGAYRVAVVPGESLGPVAYTIQIGQAAHRKERFSILDAVPLDDAGRVRLLISGGSDQGIKVGFSGRMICPDGRPLGLRVAEVFPDGAQAESVAPLERGIADGCQAEIEFPAAR